MLSSVTVFRPPHLTRGRRRTDRMIARPVHLCPSCLGVTRDLDMLDCPDCQVELVARVPLTTGRPSAASSSSPA